jgi:hypothetical protein
MFKSKRRSVVTPQSEHLKLVGTLAMLWGNDAFDAPPVERVSMISGMGSHDRGYGFIDNHPICQQARSFGIIPGRGRQTGCPEISPGENHTRLCRLPGPSRPNISSWP